VRPLGLIDPSMSEMSKASDAVSTPRSTRRSEGPSLAFPQQGHVGAPSENNFVTECVSWTGN